MRRFKGFIFAALAGAALAFAGFHGWQLIAMLVAMELWRMAQESPNPFGE